MRCFFAEAAAQDWELVLIDVVKAFILEDDPINSGGSSNSACDEVLRMDAVRRIELHAAAMKAKKKD